MIRALIFDFNGVIVDDEHLHFLLFRDVLGELGVALDEARYKADYLGFDDRGCFSAALRDAGREVDPSLVDALILDKGRRYFVAAETSLHFFPGASEIISQMAEMGPVAICSGALRAEIEYALGRLGVLDRVAGIVSAEDTSRCKPDPEGYLKALGILREHARTGLSPRDCLVIEDSLAGIAAARAAGMRVAAVTNTYGMIELSGCGADAVIKSLDELPRLLTIIGSHNRSPVGLLVSRDMIFTSKITGTAQGLGRKVVVAGDRARAAELIEHHHPAAILIDLTAGDPAGPESIAALRALAPGVVFIAFGPHVDVPMLDMARKAGVEHVMPRSKFAAELPEILRRHLPREVGE